MAGAASEDDAISLNVTPLIDIIFCLCLFFLCGFNFKQLEGKIDSWLPKDGCGSGTHAAPALTEETRIKLRRAGDGTEVLFGARLVGVVSRNADDRLVFDALESLILTTRAESKTNPVIIDGDENVPWRHVIAVVDRCKKHDITNVEFAQPMPKVR
jgi:biopolymer transport protein ExbD